MINGSGINIAFNFVSKTILIRKNRLIMANILMWFCGLAIFNSSVASPGPFCSPMKWPAGVLLSKYQNINFDYETDELSITIEGVPFKAQPK